MDKETIFNVRVDCYSGYRGDEAPRRFWFGEKKITVLGIADRWLAPDHRYFKISADDGAIYLLRHDMAQQAWEIVLYDDTGA